jgi:dTDP-4-amino-4,6-dideoxygalactose transaminase
MADVDPSSGNCTAESVRRAAGRKCVAVIVPHLFGNPAPIHDIAKIGLPVIEDCAQCVGATVQGDAVGSIGELAVFSFYATKVLAAGEGGMVTTSNRRMAGRIRSFIDYDKRELWSPAFNFKLSDVHAAIARIQLKKLNTMISARRRIADLYRRELHDLEPAIVLPAPQVRVSPIWYRYIIRVRPSKTALEQFLIGKNISCGSPVFKPLHRYLGKNGFCGTEMIHRTALSIPIFPDLADREALRICAAVRQWVEHRG